jgi:hypothetical protein
MAAELAQAIVYLITTIGAVVWVSGLWFLIRSVPKQPSAGAGLEGSDPSRRPPQGLIAGHAEIPGTPGDLSAKAAAILAKEQVKIVQRTEDRVVFEGVGATMAGVAIGQPTLRGELRFTAIGAERTGVDYAIAIPQGRVLLVLGAVFQLLGLIALVGGFFAIVTWVVPNPDPGVRAQSVQMMQVVHFLWPPFLLGGLYRMRRRTVQARFEILVNNLPYCDG